VSPYYRALAYQAVVVFVFVVAALIFGG